METRTDLRKYKCDNMKSNHSKRLVKIKQCALLVVVFLLSATNANAQATVVTIGTGTTSQYYMPCNNYYSYTYSQQIYTAAELNTGGQPMEITSIAFQYNYSSAMTAKTNCTIYMANTSKTSFSSTTDWVQYSNLTPVYTGSMNCSAGAGTYTTFTLTTPFAYDGTSSLLVCVHDNSGSYNSSTYTYRASSATNQALHVYQDGSTPYAITGSFSTTGTRPSYKSNIRLTMQPLTCPGIANLAISGTTLSWTERGTATQWIVEYGSVGFTPGTGTTVLVSGTPSYSFASLSSGIYSFYVRSYCSPGDTSRYYGPVTAAHNFNFCGGAGTQANPYLICNETDLRNLSTCVNAGVSYPNTYFRLVNNIAMAQGAFTPIGNPTTPFRGHFDGNNRSITNLTMTNTTGNHNGLFGMLIGGSIKNLTVGGTVAGGDTTGAIVGSAVSSTISGCTNNASVTGSYYAHGGIAGSIVNTKVLNCRNTGGVAGSYCTGGIVGYANTRSAIHRCSNTGTISNYSQYHGGIAGYFYNSAVNGDTVGIFACRNTGSVTGGSYTGGVVGYIYYSNVDSCSNTTNLLTSGYSYVGGVVGYAYYTKIRRCSNRGNIPGSGYVGGICGRLYGSSTAYGYLQYCVNTGHISATSTNIGGIVGYTGYSYIDHNTNSGDVITTSTSASSYVGGIAGYGTTSAYVRYNLNGGYIKSSGGYVGGICGYSYGSTYVTYNLNVNDVKGTSNVAAIAGSGAVGTNNYWDKQMCPTSFLYGTTANATCAKTTAQLVGVATYPSTTYFSATANMYPIPTDLADSIGSKLAATPIFLQNDENVNNVTRNFTVGTTNSVAWSSSNPSVISVSSANATVHGYGITQFTGTTNSMQKHIWLIDEPTFCGGSGTQADPWLICRHQTLDSLAMFVNSGIDFEGKYFKQTADLDLSSYTNWRVIGESMATPFKGHFDGNNHTISNLTITGTTQYRGLFGVVLGIGSAANQKAEIHHLTVKGDVAGGSYTGGIVGYADFTNFKKIDNYVKVGTTSYSYHGGIAGEAYTYCEFDSCHNHAMVEGSTYTGGIVGYQYTYGKITNCQNDTLINTTASNVGGIAGYFYSGNSTLTSAYEIRNCHNRGNIKGSNYVGGIVGYGYYCRTRFCDNYGPINATSYGVGGILGYIYYYSVVSGCNNYADVSSTYTGSSISSGYGTGGIVGCSNYGTAANVPIIDSCNNYGNVTSKAYLTGGIVGEIWYYGHVNKSFNYGNVSGTYYVGGVCGINRTYTNTTLANGPHVQHCGNAGDVEGTDYVGGVAGYNGYSSSSYYPYIESCVNVGRVKGTNYVGGISGYHYGSTSTSYKGKIVGCLNAGIVEATTNYAGGICGYTRGTSYGTVEYCVNAGNVISPGAYKGGVDGYTAAPTSSYFDTLMCPVSNYYGTTAATTTTGKRTSALTDGTFNPSATYFTVASGLYPRPTSIANKPITLLAATPVFLDETNPTNTINRVNTCYTVGTGNNVSWTSSDPTLTTIAGSNGTILAVGAPLLTAHKDSLTKEVDIDIVSLPAFGTFTYPAISDTIGHTITPVRPSLTSGCTFMSNDLPLGLSLNASTGEITGAVCDTLHTTFTVIASCTGCVMSQATVRIDMVPDITCAGYTVTLPAGHTWYYDNDLTIPVPNNIAVVDSNSTFYAAGVNYVTTTDFSYTGSAQTFTLPQQLDSAKLQVWGAQGGSGTGSSTTLYAGGNGGYSEGVLGRAAAGHTLGVYVGGKGMNSRAVTTTNQPYPGGWNGGGAAGVKTYTSNCYQGGSGGGGTDIRIAGNTLYARVIVAGGGGGTGYSSSYFGSVGGGTSGGASSGTYSGSPGTQTAGGSGSTSGTNAYGASAASGVNGQAGSFGQGGNGGAGTNCSGGAGGGGGWYGGGGGKSGSSTSEGGAGGGSGYVYTSSTANDYPAGCLLNSNYYLANAQTIGGDQPFEAPEGGVETGHEGDGYARITTYYNKKNIYIVNTLPLVTARISGDTSICNGTATLTIRFTGGAPYRYRITGDNSDRTANSDLVTIQVSPTTSTLYYVTFAKSTVTGCEALPDDLLGIGIVEVCGSAVLCVGDSLALPSGYTWYTDAARTNQVNGKVAPTVNTTYYRQGSTYNVIVVPRGTATILDTVYSICQDSTAEVIINFTGLPPFTYRITGDRTDRVTSSNTVRVPVWTDTSAIVKVTYFSDQNPRCSGVINHSNAQIILCDQPIICYGDTVWLPEGKWFYDFYMTRPITTPYVIPDQTTVYYQKVNDTVDFDYTGDEQIYRIPSGTDSVFMQVWGAQGGGRQINNNSNLGIGGKGGYAEGKMKVSNGDVLYIYVGGEGEATDVTLANGGFNGGGCSWGSSASDPAGSGGGASDIRVNGNTYYHRVLVAGGGGGGGEDSELGGYGGGLTGGQGYTSISAATQTGTGTGGAFGQAAHTAYDGGGGGGWYGGGASGGTQTIPTANNSSDGNGGAGGSGYVYTATTASNYPSGCMLNSSYYLSNAQTIAGNVAFPSPTGTSETGHEGDGYARIIARGSREFTILVLDNTVATMPDTTLNICNNQSAQLEINFQGTPPFAYRITGDTADRICNNNQAHVTVSPTITTNYQVTYVAGDVCEGKTSNTYTTVMVCNQPIICAGDTAYLPAGSTWYYDQNMTQAVADTFVTPVVTTTYYGNNNATFTVTVNPVATASILSNTYNVCDSAAVLELFFSGTTPFYYRITGDTADRVAYSDTVRIPVSPDTTTQYHITAFRDVYCNGTFNNDMATVMICDQPIICKGDTVWLDPTKTWFRDSTMLDTIKTAFVVPTKTTTYYSGGGSGGDTLNFRYTGDVQIFTVPSGVDSVFMQVWGAQGGSCIASSASIVEIGGKGGYSEGKMHVRSGDVLNVYVGGVGQSNVIGRTGPGGFNGGGYCVQTYTSGSNFTAGSGGGASDIRVNSTSLYARAIVAGGGGGTANGGSTAGRVPGYGGGTQGGNATQASGTYQCATGGTQTAGGTFGWSSSSSNANASFNGSFGQGGCPVGASASSTAYSGGGGGWYGGGAGGWNSGGGGSGYVYTAATASNYPTGCLLNSFYYLDNGMTIAGNMSFPDTTFRGSMETGHEGNGYARIITIGPNIQAFRVTVKPSYSDTIRQTLCAGASYTHNDSVYTVQGTYYQYFESYDHCDSIEVIEITVNDTLRDTIHPVICAGASFDTNGYLGCATVSGQDYAPYFFQGVYTQYLRDTVTGCFQNLVIDLTVNDTLRDTIYPVVCAGVTFDTNGHLGCVPVSGQNYAPYWIQGVYTQYLRDPQTGCFQNLVIDLTVTDTIRDTLYHTICPSGHFTLNGHTYTDTGYYHQLLKTPLGCDSALTIVIDRSDTLRETIYRDMCWGTSLVINAETYYDTGWYRQHLNNLDGCDSILTIHIRYADTLRDTIHPIICAGDTFVHNNVKYFRTGLYNQYWLSIHGCDSLIYIDLTVRDTLFGTTYDTICAGGFTVINGETFREAGTYHQILQASVQCDSFVTVYIHMNDTLRDTINQTICAGQTITVNGQRYWTDGQHKQYLRDPQTDCYHNYVINLTVNDTLRDTIHPVVCAGAIFDTNGVQYWVAGYYTQYLRDPDSCFRNLVVHLQVNDTIRDTIEPWICAGQVFRWNRVPYSVAGWYRQEFRTPEGCDSILHIHLIVGDTLRDTAYFSVCSGQTLTHNGVTYSSTGWYRQNLKNFDDCDSVLHIHLTIEDTIRGHLYDTICYGDTYTFNGSTYNIPGVYPFITQTREGCDSIAYLHLHVNDTIITHVYDTICRDGSYYYLDSTYFHTGDYVHLLKRVTGCDSTVVLHLFERDSIQSVHYDTICNNTTFNYYGQVLSRTGRYPHRHTSVLTGCDSIEWLNLTVLDYPVLSILDSGAYCEGGYATLKANTTGNYITWTSSPYDPSMNGQDHNFTIYVSPDRYTEYTATVDIRPYNCRNTVVHAVNKPTKVEARMSMSPEEITSENLQCTFTDVSVGTIMYREWLFHENVPTIPDKMFYGDRTVNYTSSIENDTLQVRLIVVNDEGCYDTAINLFPIFRGDVWVPNAFTPGRIGANRLLQVGHYNLLEYEIFIYTREGLLVFHSNDPDISWDGTYNYKDCKPGSYVYIVHYRTKSRPSESYEKKGSVLLIR